MNKFTGLMARRVAETFIGLLLLALATLAHAEMVSVSINEANLRSGAGSTHPVQWRVIKGFPLEVITRQGNWLQVRDFEGDVTWIYSDSVSDKPFVIVTGDIVNLRSEPSTTSRIVSKVEYGSVLERLEVKGDWVKVKIGSTTGWIAASYVWGAK